MHSIFFKITLVFVSLLSTQIQASLIPYRKNNKRFARAQSQPNILILMADEWRHPVSYENDELRAWRRANLKTSTFLEDNGVTFDNYYCASTACNPGRATIFTGQYPSLHGVSQTTGAAKNPSDPSMYWLSPYMVPTLGNIFLASGYENHYHGKWHVADVNLYNPGTNDFVLSYDATTGIINPYLVNLYKNANMMRDYGFNNGWVGPEPEGNNVRESGSSAAIGTSGRDVYYAQETVNLLNKLNKEKSSSQPWLIVCSFVNPHDINLYGEVAKLLPAFNFEIDSSLPYIAPAPSADEDLSTKPIAQQSYKDDYQKVFQPTVDTLEYRQLYYTLLKKVDGQMGLILDTLLETRFKNNTIVLFMGDHGSLIGGHGMFQKFFNIYEESIHIPLTFYSPTLLPQGVHIDLLANHVDVVPTLCSLAGIEVDDILNTFAATYTNSRPLVGRDLSSLVLGTATPSEITALTDSLLFVTYDNVFTGALSVSPLGAEFSPVVQPSSIEAVITKLNGQIWKLAKYYHNATFDSPLSCTCSTPVDSTEAEDQYEMYNLAQDPYELVNLAHPEYATGETIIVQNYLIELLNEQLALKALTPYIYSEEST